MTGATTDQSLRTISAELESLQNSDTITSQTHKAIDALLPHGNRLETCQPDVNASPNKLKHQKAGNASTSNIADTKSNPDPPPRITNDNLASAIALAAQNPDHPAHPNHPRVSFCFYGLTIRNIS